MSDGIHTARQEWPGMCETFERIDKKLAKFDEVVEKGEPKK